MIQLELPYTSPTVDLDGLVDSRGVIFIGRAQKHWPSGKWRCLANVDGALCVVELRLEFGEIQERRAQTATSALR